MRKAYYRIAAICASAYLLLPDWVLAAGGKAEMLVNVADVRKVHWWVSVWFLDMYNADPFMFGVWCVILTAGLGCSLGLITDFFMKRTGIDLTSRKIVEH